MDDEVQIIKACDIEKNIMGASHKIINPFYHAASGPKQVTLTALTSDDKEMKLIKTLTNSNIL